MARMKRLQISLEHELDAALGAEARRQGVSKAALIRRWVADELNPLPPLRDDPLWNWVGGEAGEPDDSASIDEVVYERSSSTVP
jgi:hypothetical protein